MHRVKRIGYTAMVLSVILGVAHAEDRKVVSLASSPVALFEQNGGNFQRTGDKLAAQDVALPTVILQESARGYVQIQTKRGVVWLDEVDVKIFPQKKLPHQDCIKTIGSTADASLTATRGYGEQCK